MKGVILKEKTSIVLVLMGLTDNMSDMYDEYPEPTKEHMLANLRIINAKLFELEQILKEESEL